MLRSSWLKVTTELAVCTKSVSKTAPAAVMAEAELSAWDTCQAGTEVPSSQARSLISTGAVPVTWNSARTCWPGLTVNGRLAPVSQVLVEPI